MGTVSSKVKHEGVKIETGQYTSHSLNEAETYKNNNKTSVITQPSAGPVLTEADKCFKNNGFYFFKHLIYENEFLQLTNVRDFVELNLLIKEMPDEVLEKLYRFKKEFIPDAFMAAVELERTTQIYQKECLTSKKVLNNFKFCVVLILSFFFSRICFKKFVVKYTFQYGTVWAGRRENMNVL